MFRFGIAMFALLIGLLATAACGGSSDDGDPGRTTTPESRPAVEAATEVELDFVLSDFAIAGPDSVEAGRVRFNVANEGAAIHELLIVRTDAEADALPVEGGVVVEAELDVVGEIEEFAGGEDRSAAFELSAGRYLLICNVPGHFTLGMVTEFTVT